MKKTKYNVKATSQFKNITSYLQKEDSTLTCLMKLLPYLLEEKNHQNGIMIMRSVATGAAMANVTIGRSRAMDFLLVQFHFTMSRK